MFGIGTRKDIFVYKECDKMKCPRCECEMVVDKIYYVKEDNITVHYFLCVNDECDIIDAEFHSMGLKRM